MPDEESYLDVSLRKIVKGAGIGFAGTLIGRAFGYGSGLITSYTLYYIIKYYRSVKNGREKDKHNWFWLGRHGYWKRFY